MQRIGVFVCHCGTNIAGTVDVAAVADALEKATLSTIESGKMTKDLALITSLKDVTVLNSHDFIKAIREKLEELSI